MVDQSNLGPAASWHIRSIPEGVRQAVVDQAHAERISVGELLTRMVVHAGDSLVAHGEVDAVSHAGDTVDAVEHAVDADRLLKLLQAADLVSKVVLPPRAQNAARAMIATEIRSMRRAQLPPKRVQPSLPGPEYPAETPSDPPEPVGG